MTTPIRNENCFSPDILPWVRWAHQRHDLDSAGGYRAMDLDSIWLDESTGSYLIFEIKTYMAEPTESQRRILSILSQALKSDPNFAGVFLLQFTKSSGPSEEGQSIFLNRQPISLDDFILFLQGDPVIRERYSGRV